MLIVLTLFACGDPPTREEIDKRYIDAIVQDVSIYHPRENVECYVLRGYNESNPRSISCVTLPQPVKP
jgi:hypothetical protein